MLLVALEHPLVREAVKNPPLLPSRSWLLPVDVGSLALLDAHSAFLFPPWLTSLSRWATRDPLFCFFPPPPSVGGIIGSSGTAPERSCSGEHWVMVKSALGWPKPSGVHGHIPQRLGSADGLLGAQFTDASMKLEKDLPAFLLVRSWAEGSWGLRRRLEHLAHRSKMFVVSGATQLFPSGKVCTRCCWWIF